MANQSLFAGDRLGRVLDAVCERHRMLKPAFICGGCGAGFCARCARTVGTSTAAACTLCGSLCLAYGEARQRALLLSDQRQPFGLADLRFALRYPLRHSVTVAGLGVAYGACLFSLPFFNIAGVGVLLGALGLGPAFVANAMMFGCAGRVIRSVETGLQDSPEVFDLSALLADFWETAKLGLAILAATAWPLLLRQTGWLAPRSSSVIVILWGIIYYPLALAVAAINQSFGSTINPVAGLGFALRLGADFIKLFIMYLLVAGVAAAIVWEFLRAALPFGVNLPVLLMVGVAAGPPIFWANMVIASLIGRALFKRESE